MAIEFMTPIYDEMGRKGKNSSRIPVFVLHVKNLSSWQL